MKSYRSIKNKRKRRTKRYNRRVLKKELKNYPNIKEIMSYSGAHEEDVKEHLKHLYQKIEYLL